MKITKVSQDCVLLIAKWEGFEKSPYLCPANVPTIGYGTTRYPDGKKVTLKDKDVNQNEALVFLNYDIKAFSLSVDAIAVDTITQSQFDALVSFAYNLGSHALKNSTLLRVINANQNNSRIAKEFKRWVYAGGKKLQGLISRRNEESELYFKDLMRIK
jgi:lysozyme